MVSISFIIKKFRLIMFLTIMGFILQYQSFGFAGTANPSEALLRYINEGGADSKIVKGLIEYGADLNFRDSRTGKTPLHYAAINRSIESVRLLSKLGADVNAVDKEKRTPLHEAMSYHSPEIVRLLIDKGADIHSRNMDGKTPLYSIIFWDDEKSALETVNLFIEKGFAMHLSADADLLNESISRKRKNIALIFLKKGIPSDEFSIVRAVTAGYDDIFSILLDRGVNPLQAGILNGACRSGNMNIVRTLTAKGVKPTADDIDFCLFHGHKEAALYLNKILKDETSDGVDITLRCRMRPDGGFCKALFRHAYFDTVSGTCREFTYGGCGGAVPFESLEACKRVCEERKDAP